MKCFLTFHLALAVRRSATGERSQTVGQEKAFSVSEAGEPSPELQRVMKYLDDHGYHTTRQSLLQEQRAAETRSIHEYLLANDYTQTAQALLEETSLAPAPAPAPSLVQTGSGMGGRERRCYMCGNRREGFTRECWTVGRCPEIKGQFRCKHGIPDNKLEQPSCEDLLRAVGAAGTAAVITQPKAVVMQEIIMPLPPPPPPPRTYPEERDHKRPIVEGIAGDEYATDGEGNVQEDRIPMQWLEEVFRLGSTLDPDLREFTMDFDSNEGKHIGVVTTDWVAQAVMSIGGGSFEGAMGVIEANGGEEGGKFGWLIDYITPTDFTDM